MKSTWLSSTLQDNITHVDVPSFVIKDRIYKYFMYYIRETYNIFYKYKKKKNLFILISHRDNNGKMELIIFQKIMTMKSQNQILDIFLVVKDYT